MMTFWHTKLLVRQPCFTSLAMTNTLYPRISVDPFSGTYFYFYRSNRFWIFLISWRKFASIKQFKSKISNAYNSHTRVKCNQMESHWSASGRWICIKWDKERAHRIRNAHMKFYSHFMIISFAILFCMGWVSFTTLSHLTACAPPGCIPAEDRQLRCLWIHAQSVQCSISPSVARRRQLQVANRI